jgi:pimeloyl-ACP methyl ester carboxylesterase
VNTSTADGAEVQVVDGPTGPLAYRDVGPSDAGTIVFIHGVNMAAGVWDGAIAHLHGFRCITFDLRGHGRSHHNGPFFVDDYLDDTVAVMDATEVEDVQLVGVSMGGLLSIALAQRLPDRVRSAVAFGSSFVGEHRGVNASMAKMRAMGVRDYFSWSLPQGSLPPDAPQAVRDKAISIAVEGREDPDLVEAVIRAAFHRDMSYILPKPAERPTLVVTGEFDATCTPQGGKELAEAAGGSWRLIPGVGHVIPLEDPALCARIVADFYDSAEEV